VAQSLERVADLATNIAEETVFLVEGRVIRHLPEEAAELPVEEGRGEHPTGGVGGTPRGDAAPLGRTPAGDAVEQLLEEVEAETEPAGAPRGGRAPGEGGHRHRGLHGGSGGRWPGPWPARAYTSPSTTWTGEEAPSTPTGPPTSSRATGSGSSTGRGLHPLRRVTASWTRPVRARGAHILVNNAGMAHDGALWRMSDEDWAEVLDTNLTGAFYFTRAVAPSSEPGRRERS
jgi:NAD(P)-dependent dehydrogenase (short-subunit alcohol dehydrogenase family)